MNIFNILEAATIIHLLVKNPDGRDGEMELKNFDQGLGLFETFLESVPSVFIITVIWLLSTFGEKIKKIFRINFTSYYLLQVNLYLIKVCEISFLTPTPPLLLSLVFRGMRVL